MSLVERQISRLSVHGRGRGEYDPAAACFVHCRKQVHRATDIVLIVMKRQHVGLADGLQASKMYDRVGYKVRERACQQGGIAKVALNRYDVAICELAHTGQRGWRAIAIIIKNANIMSREKQLDQSVAADIACATGDENFHCDPFALRLELPKFWP